jgi:hypothetical protein
VTGVFSSVGVGDSWCRVVRVPLLGVDASALVGTLSARRLLVPPLEVPIAALKAACARTTYRVTVLLFIGGSAEG